MTTNATMGYIIGIKGLASEGITQHLIGIKFEES